MGGEDRRLGARRVVLGQLGDRLEQVRAEPVVEELRRDARRRAASSGTRGVALGPGVGEPGLDESGRSRNRASGGGSVQGGRGARPRTLPRDRPECSDASNRRARPSGRDPPRGACSARGRDRFAWRCRGDSLPPRTSFAPGRRAGRCRRSTLVDLAGKPWRLEALAGQVVVLNFWATWCAPCRLEMPSLDAMAARRGREGVVVAAVNYKEAAEVIRRFLERAPFKSQILLDATATRPSPGRRASSRPPCSSAATARRCTSSSASSTGKAQRPRRCSIRSSRPPAEA